MFRKKGESKKFEKPAQKRQRRVQWGEKGDRNTMGGGGKTVGEGANLWDGADKKKVFL